MKRLLDLYQKQIITEEEFKEIESNPNVKMVQNMGYEDSMYHNKQLIVVTLKDWEELTYYL